MVQSSEWSVLSSASVGTSKRTIRLVNQNTGELELEASHDLFGEDHGPLFVGEKKASFAQSVVDSKQAVLITDAANDPAVPFLNTTAATSYNNSKHLYSPFTVLNHRLGKP